MNTGQIIRLVRTAEGLGQGELATELRISRTYLCQIENGHKQPSLTFLKQFAQQFSVPLPLLVFGEKADYEDNMLFDELREIFAKVLVSRTSQAGE